MPPHVGRGGWTWYTGSAAWLYRAGIESILGLRLESDSMTIDPCIPASWPGFEMTLRYRGAVYEIAIHNPGGVNRGVIAAELDGASHAPCGGSMRLKLGEDCGTHRIVVTLGITSTVVPTEPQR